MSFFSRILGRQPSAADPEGWQVGDWAERISMGQWVDINEGTIQPGPRHGQTMRVTGVEIRRNGLILGGRALCLSFAGWPDQFYTASAFRKLMPRADAAAPAEAAFTDQLRRPARTIAPVTLPAEKIEEFQ